MIFFAGFFSLDFFTKIGYALEAAVLWVDSKRSKVDKNINHSGVSPNNRKKRKSKTKQTNLELDGHPLKSICFFSSNLYTGFKGC